MKRIYLALFALLPLYANAQLVEGMQRASSFSVPPASGSVVLLGDANAGDVSETDGVYTITARGTEDPHDGTWLPLQTVAGGNVQVTWRMASALSNGGTVPDFAAVGMQFRTDEETGITALSWYPEAGRCRFKVQPTAETSSYLGGFLGDSAAEIPWYCGMVYNAAFPRVEFWESETGGSSSNWTLIGTEPLDLGASYVVGLYGVGFSTSVTVTGTVDNVEVGSTITLIEESGGEPEDNPTTVISNTYGTEFDQTYNGDWNTSAVIVIGHDWSLPPGTSAASNSGVFNLNTSVPTYFTGNHLKQINCDWEELEPTQGNYDLSCIVDGLTDLDYDGGMLNVRGIVKDAEDSNGQPVSGPISAPPHIRNSCPSTKEGLKNGFRLTNCHIYDATVKAGYIALIDEIGSQTHAELGGLTIPASGRLKAQIIHGVSSSRGEEWTGIQASTTQAEDAMIDLLEAWQEAYGANTFKLAWLKENPQRLFDAAVIDAETGIRGGAVEMWLRNQYTVPGKGDLTGQVVNQGTGYITINEAFPPILHGRHFQDQNEEYRAGSKVPQEFWARNYRHATLRSVQMRRNVMWIAKNSHVDPRMDAWLGLQLGQTADTASDAWVWLMRTWSYYQGSPLEINNLERWLYQRESNGATTPASACCRLDHGFNAAGNQNLPSANWYVDAARLGSSIGIAVDDDWLTGAHNIVLKLTYLDTGSGDITINYDNGGAGGTCTIGRQNSLDVRTASCFLTDFEADAAGTDDDFTIDSDGTAPIIMARLVKCGGSFASCT